MRETPGGWAAGRLSLAPHPKRSNGVDGLQAVSRSGIPARHCQAGMPDILLLYSQASIESGQKQNGRARMSTATTNAGSRKPLQTVAEINIGARIERRKRLVPRAGLEPTTCGLGIRRSVLLSYRGCMCQGSTAWESIRERGRGVKTAFRFGKPEFGSSGCRCVARVQSSVISDQFVLYPAGVDTHISKSCALN